MLEGKKLEGVIGFFLPISLALSPHNNMSAKKLINSPDEVVDEVLEGLTMIHPGLRLLEGHRVVVREQIDRGKVSLISGGGSDHEPFCAVYRSGYADWGGGWQCVCLSTHSFYLGWYQSCGQG